MGKRTTAGNYEYRSLSSIGNSAGGYERVFTRKDSREIDSFAIQDDTMETHPVVASNGFWYIEAPMEESFISASVEETLLSEIHTELAFLMDDPPALQAVLQALKEIRQHKVARDDDLDFWLKAAGSSMAAMWDNDEDASFDDL